mmetsp:Transcript_6234/g.7660  ORF Transcript_6234/g.7660 Transcript_6234/m.7660 type:complete len:726 (-) Transcript_6234:18-2195(-)
MLNTCEIDSPPMTALQGPGSYDFSPLGKQKMKGCNHVNYVRIASTPPHTRLRSCIDSQYRGKLKMIHDFTQSSSSSPFVATVPYRVSPLKNGEEIFGYCTPERTETTCRSRGGMGRNNQRNELKTRETPASYTEKTAPRAISEKCVFRQQLQFNGMKSSTAINGAINNNLEYADTSAQVQTPRDCVGYSDRFIPSRQSSNLSPSALDDSDCQWSADDGQARPTNPISDNEFIRNMRSNAVEERIIQIEGNDGSGRTNEDDFNGGRIERETAGNYESDGGGSIRRPIRSMLLRSELLGIRNVSSTHSSHHRRIHQRNKSDNISNIFKISGSTAQHEENAIFRYQSPRSVYHRDVFNQSDASLKSSGTLSVLDSFDLNPVGLLSKKLLFSPKKRKRYITKVPFKVLDAPALQDDFYLNLVDWSSQNMLAVGLGSCVYLWNACTSKIIKLCDLATSDDIVTSVAWTQRGAHLSVGTNRGKVQIWDVTKCEMVQMRGGGHRARIGSMAWNGPVLASGGRDCIICLCDVRNPQRFVAKLSSHKQEICGLKWSLNDAPNLASGGNDNKLLVWDIKRHNRPLRQHTEHIAAVKAIAWSPHQHGLLASGGGTADRCIRFWNNMGESSIGSIDTGSQVCNLAWSQNCNELVSTHGYSLNQIVLWRYPSMTKVTTLTGHSYRVLFLAVSPDGSNIVTGAGDETLRFWQVFPRQRTDRKNVVERALFPSSPKSVVR